MRYIHGIRPGLNPAGLHETFHAAGQSDWALGSDPLTYREPAVWAICR